MNLALLKTLSSMVQAWRDPEVASMQRAWKCANELEAALAQQAQPEDNPLTIRGQFPDSPYIVANKDNPLLQPLQQAQPEECRFIPYTHEKVQDA